MASPESREPITPPPPVQPRRPQPAPTTPRLRPPAPERQEIARPITQPVPVVTFDGEPELNELEFTSGYDYDAEFEAEFQSAPALVGAPMASASPARPMPMFEADLRPMPEPEPVLAIEPGPEVDEAPVIVIDPEPLEAAPAPSAPPFRSGPPVAQPVAPAAPVVEDDVATEGEAEDLERLFWTESEALADLQDKGRSRSGRILGRLTGTHRKID